MYGAGKQIIFFNLNGAAGLLGIGAENQIVSSLFLTATSNL